MTFTAYAHDCNELRDKNGGFIGYYEVVSKWYRPRRYRSDSNWFESIKITIQDSGITYHGRHCLDTREVILKPYAGQEA